MKELVIRIREALEDGDLPLCEALLRRLEEELDGTE